ncbi:hypothetical protein DRW07_07625 [Alteromonas sediminis]|uniref:Tail specific protease domain-containing protein n=1 Tax=Alteromonas sediminis TaxID=2259342 RepID=A0A3N5Z8Z4_9ALTE|nr:hypothetical protein [Alteromonas sediminis]RPJ67384.1 hypothetical protein DRW07_07625 [Alteromonas sediminis]
MNLLKKTISVLSVCLFTACGGNTGETSDIQYPSEEERWSADINYMVERMISVHPDIYHTVSEVDFETAKQQLLDDIGGLDAHQRLVRILEVFALPASQRDGHMALSYYAGTDSLILPLKFHQFDDGIYLIDATTENEEFIGSKLLAIEGLSLVDVNELLDPLLPRDNAQSLESARSIAYLNPSILNGLGITNSPTETTFVVERRNGQISDMRVLATSPTNFPLSEVPSNKLPKNALVNYLKPGNDLWVEFYPQWNTIHVKLNAITDSSGNIALDDIAREVQELLIESPSAKIVIDLRQNSGGNNQLVEQLIEFVKSPVINIQGRLHVFTDRQTFSAAGNLVAELDYKTNAMFWGVPPGGSGSQFGDVNEFTMPNSGMIFYVPTKFWQFGDPSRQTLSQPMDHWVDQTIEGYLSNLDTLMDYFVAEMN